MVHSLSLNRIYRLSPLLGPKKIINLYVHNMIVQMTMYGIVVIFS